MNAPASDDFQLINATTADVVVPRLNLAVTFLTRFRGLQFRRELPPDEGLLIAPCRSIHTHWMRFSIDVLMLSQDGTVLELRPDMRPWRTYSGPREAAAVLEVPAKSAAVQIGDRLAVMAPPGRSLPERLQAMRAPGP